MSSATQTPKTRIRSRLTPFENIAVGAVGGCLETTLQMPILTFKFTKQEGRPMPTTLGGWYRGVFVQAGTVAPITALQVMLNGMLGSMVLQGEKRNLTDLEKMSTSAGAGALSAFVYGPVDLTTIQQQKLGLNPIQTLQSVMKEHGNLSIFRGFSACAIREAIYTAGYLGLGPVATIALAEGPMKDSPFGAAVTGACFAGVAAGLLTHPFDTAKTCIQADMKGEEFRTARQTIPKLIKERGFTSLFRGGAARALRNCGAFYIVISMREYFIDYKTEQDSLE
jgi:solute carrier family 25 2-oxodicarboxylate transporter 21|tara:strand:+ start:25 stop:867 length:843 start_codon:yes stop_codon:yes gene_type:complete